MCVHLTGFSESLCASGRKQTNQNTSPMVEVDFLFYF